jgi:cysteine desulfurase
MAAYDAGWADPTRLYREGRTARMLLDAARESVAATLGPGVRADEVTFTGSVALARQLAVLGVAAATASPIAATAVEHSAVLAAADRRGLVVVPVGPDGRVAPREAATVATGAAALAIQAANSELGVLQPLQEVLDLVEVPVVVDAGPAVGLVDLPPGWQVLVAGADCAGGPTGVGILAVRGGRWRPPLPTDEPVGRVAGTPDVPSIVAAARALELRRDDRALLAGVRTHRDRLVREIPRTVDDVHVLGSAEHSLPHMASFTILYADGERLIEALDAAGFAVASGSACTSDTRRPSHVLVAIGAVTHGNLRIGLPLTTTADDVDRFLLHLPDAVVRARRGAE